MISIVLIYLQFRHSRDIFVPGGVRLVPRPSSGKYVRGIVDGNAGELLV
jgi:hypothetical protein